MKLLIASAFWLPLVCLAAPPMMLAQEYRQQNIQGWLMSEKLDGVRAYWDGKQLISRQGYPFTPPSDFVHNFPPYPLDGELYSKRGDFENNSATVRKNNSNWQDIKLHVFDVPKAAGRLDERLAVITQRINLFPANIVVIQQIPVNHFSEAEAYLKKIVTAGGEGIILRNPNAPYASGRSSDYLKLKLQQDAECIVTQHHEGKGKYTGKLGAISCRNENGEFKIGSGFKDSERNTPPPVGSIITYRHRGFTEKGLPRFATYLRIRNDH